MFHNDKITTTMKGKVTVYYELPFLEEYIKRHGQKVKAECLYKTIDGFFESAVLKHVRDNLELITQVTHYMLTQYPVCKGSREVFRALPNKALYINIDGDENELNKHCNQLREKLVMNFKMKME